MVWPARTVVMYPIWSSLVVHGGDVGRVDGSMFLERLHLHTPRVHHENMEGTQNGSILNMKSLKSDGSPYF